MLQDAKTPSLVGKTVEAARQSLKPESGLTIRERTLDPAKMVIRQQFPAPDAPVPADKIIRVYATSCITVKDYSGMTLGELQAKMNDEWITVYVHDYSSGAHGPITDPTQRIQCNCEHSKPGNQVCAGGEIGVMLDGCQAGLRKFVRDNARAAPLSSLGLTLLAGALIGALLLWLARRR